MPSRRWQDGAAFVLNAGVGAWSRRLVPPQPDPKLQLNEVLALDVAAYCSGIAGEY